MRKLGKHTIAPFRIFEAWRRQAAYERRRHPARCYLWCVLSAPLYLFVILLHTFGWFLFPLHLLFGYWPNPGQIPSGPGPFLCAAVVAILWARVFLTQLKAATRQLADRVLDLGTLWSLVMMFLAYCTALWFVGYNFGKQN
jgi:hypothetical protein